MLHTLRMTTIYSFGLICLEIRHFPFCSTLQSVRHDNLIYVDLTFSHVGKLYLQVLFKTKAYQGLPNTRPYPNACTNLSKVGSTFVDIDVECSTCLGQSDGECETADSPASVNDNRCSVSQPSH